MNDEQPCIARLTAVARELEVIAELKRQNSLEAIERARVGRERMKASFESMARLRQAPSVPDTNPPDNGSTQQGIRDSSQIDARWQDALVEVYDAIIEIEQFPSRRDSTVRILGIVQDLRTPKVDRGRFGRSKDLEAISLETIERRGLLVQNLMKEVSALSETALAAGLD